MGVGFDTKGAGTVTVKGPKSDKVDEFVVPDSREGTHLFPIYFVENFFL